MPKYTIYGMIGASKCFGEVEAASEQEAVAKAWEDFETHISLCHQCAHEIDAEEIYKFDAELTK